MIPQNTHFEVRPSLITGDTADVYLHRTQRILRSEGLNPVVLMEFSAGGDGTLCGTQEVKAVLSSVTAAGNREVWAVEEGSRISRGEVCLTVRAPYSSFGLYETAITGILAHSSGWASAAYELVKAANGVPVVNVGAHNVHPTVAPVMDYAAVVGGCAGGSTALGGRLTNTQPVSSVGGALLQIIGDPNRALQAFDRSVPPDAKRIAYVDPRRDIVEQVVAVARLMRDRLDAVRLARVPGGKQVPAETVHEVRERLDSLGCKHTIVIVSGFLSPERIASLLDEGAPVGMFHDGGYIAAAQPMSFRPAIRSISDRPVQQETEPAPPNPRLLRLL